MIRQCLYTIVDLVQTNRLYVIQPDLDRRNVEIVDSSVLKSFVVVGQVMMWRSNCRQRYRSSGEPSLTQLVKLVFSNEQASQSCGISEDLVEADRNEVRGDHSQI